MRALLFVTALSACNGEEPQNGEHRCGALSGVVTDVLDGDTVDLASGERVRYLLVDAPEVAHSASEESECYGDEAKAVNADLVLDEEVQLEYDEECLGFYGRTLAYVHLGDRMVNRVLIERGAAEVSVFEPNGAAYVEEFEQLEAAARAAGAGQWGVCP